MGPADTSLHLSFHSKVDRSYTGDNRSGPLNPVNIRSCPGKRSQDSYMVVTCGRSVDRIGLDDIGVNRSVTTHPERSGKNKRSQSHLGVNESFAPPRPVAPHFATHQQGGKRYQVECPPQ